MNVLAATDALNSYWISSFKFQPTIRGERSSFYLSYQALESFLILEKHHHTVLPPDWHVGIGES